MKKSGYTMGLLVRGYFRRWCFELGLNYKEDRGWLDSGFIVEGNENKIQLLDTHLEMLNKETL